METCQYCQSDRISAIGMCEECNAFQPAGASTVNDESVSAAPPQVGSTPPEAADQGESKLQFAIALVMSVVAVLGMYFCGFLDELAHPILMAVLVILNSPVYAIVFFSVFNSLEDALEMENSLIERAAKIDHKDKVKEFKLTIVLGFCALFVLLQYAMIGLIID